MIRYAIGYQYGTYSGTETVICDDDADPVQIFWARMSRQGHLTLGMAARSAWVESQEYIDDTEGADYE